MLFRILFNLTDKELMESDYCGFFRN